MNKNIAVLVVSCDAYSDLWDPFFKLFFKYWSDCPHKIYLSSNYKKYDHPNVISVKSNEISDWSSELKIALNKIEEEHIIVILEDYFFYSEVNSKQLNNIIDTYYKMNALFFRLGTFPARYYKLWPHKKLKSFPGIVEILKNSKFRISLQVAIWNKSYLSDLLVPGESPWLFEITASERTNKSDQLFLGLEPIKWAKGVHGPISYLAGAITKGVWMREALSIAKDNGIDLDTSHRMMETKIQFIKRKIYIAMPLSIRKIIDKLFSIFS